MRSAVSMEPIQRELARVDSESKKLRPDSTLVRTAIAFSYASTREPISKHSAAFRELVENLPGQASDQRGGT